VVFVSALSVGTAGVIGASVHEPSKSTPAAGVRQIAAPATVSIPEILSHPAPGPGQPLGHLAQVLHFNDSGGSTAPDNITTAPDQSRATAPQATPAQLPAGAAGAPGSPVVNGGGPAQTFPGLDLATMEKAGTGKYKGTNGGLEPPDQALCVGNGYVIQGVNQAFQILSTSAVALTPAIPMVQFFQLLPSATVGPSSFVSDPRCIYDAATKRFFVSTLEADTVTTGVFGRSHNIFAVSKTSDPTKDWYIYSFDVTDDGLGGTPAHLTCPCIGDQPLIGADANGFYVSSNEFSDAEILPIQPPPAVNKVLNTVFTLPDFRNGQAQVYALSKQKLVSGQIGPVIQFDTNTVAVPQGSGNGAVWSSLQPAHSPPGDKSVMPSGGAEYFLSQLDFQMKSDNRVAVWALTNTASINAAKPSLALHNTVITTQNPADTYAFPTSADQKAGPMPIGATCVPSACAEEKLNANDDRMNEVMLTSGVLWSGLNTKLPPINAGGTAREKDARTGIMYFAVRPSVTNGQLSATMVRDGYVVVPRQNVLFPSVGANPAGHVVMGFTLSGVDYYPSGAWAQLDGLGPNQAPTVHVSAAGAAPEDGFTGYCGAGLLPFPLNNLGGLCTDGISRWGDYSFTVVDEKGCIWTAAEYISGGARDPIAGNWATSITRIAPPGCKEPALTPK
jgi:hypothetical protein